MPKDIHKEGADPEKHHDRKATAHHRVASRLEGVVKNRGTKEKKKEKK